MMLDEEYVQMLHEARERRAASSSSKSRPSQAYWGATTELLAVLVDRISTLIEAQSSKPRDVVPYPRPETALERVRYRARWKQHETLVARVLPWKA